MNCRAIIKVFVDKLLESFNHLRRNIGIELDDYAAVISGINDCDLRVGLRFDTRLDVSLGLWVAVKVFAGCRV